MRNRASAIAVLGLIVFLAAPAPMFAQAQVERGMKVFADSKCSLCHSVAGKGNPKGALDEVGTRLSAAEMHEWITHPEAMRQKTKAERKPMMKSFSTLPKEDVDALIAYLQTLKKK